jgi:hypothetical protein
MIDKGSSHGVGDEELETLLSYRPAEAGVVTRLAGALLSTAFSAFSAAFFVVLAYGVVAVLIASIWKVTPHDLVSWLTKRGGGYRWNGLVGIWFPCTVALVSLAVVVERRAEVRLAGLVSVIGFALLGFLAVSKGAGVYALILVGVLGVVTPMLLHGWLNREGFAVPNVKLSERLSLDEFKEKYEEPTRSFLASSLAAWASGAFEDAPLTFGILELRAGENRLQGLFLDALSTARRARRIAVVAAEAEVDEFYLAQLDNDGPRGVVFTNRALHLWTYNEHDPIYYRDFATMHAAKGGSLKSVTLHDGETVEVQKFFGEHSLPTSFITSMTSGHSSSTG